jgi:uncharacterized protein YjiS (DUF1127 family)
MTAIHWHAIRSGPRHHNAVAALSDAWGNVGATLREWRRRVHDRAELARLDNRMLQDIGLTRGDAGFLINKPFWRE